MTCSHSYVLCLLLCYVNLYWMYLSREQGMPPYISCLSGIICIFKMLISKERFQRLYQSHSNFTLTVHDCSTTPGYTWSSEYRVCFKYHSTKRDYISSKSLCKEEDARSHLFLVDSDNSFAFLEHIIGLYKSHGIQDCLKLYLLKVFSV